MLNDAPLRNSYGVRKTNDLKDMHEDMDVLFSHLYLRFKSLIYGTSFKIIKQINLIFSVDIFCSSDMSLNNQRVNMKKF